MFKGSNVALITPFKNNKLDVDNYIELIHFHIKNGTNGLVPAGTTGESPTLTHEEHKKIISLCVDLANKRIPVIAGTGSNSTEEAISLTKYAKQVGADGALIVTPYYNKPTQQGLFEHFKAINDNCDIPIIIYNIPGRSVVDMNVDTMYRLSELPNIVGVKDATNDLTRPLLTLDRCGQDFCQLSGEDGTVVPFLSQGGHGCISVTANIAPRKCADLHNAWQKKDLKKVQEINLYLSPLNQALFAETSPAPTKYAASLLNICLEDCRLPLSQVSGETKKLIKKTLHDLKIYSNK